jgi:hypothetical protein
LVAFFGSMYFGALRPAEAATLRKANLALPAKGWGELLLESSTPEAGASWTDSGRRREERQLKHRAKGETRVVPCPPELTALLHEHLEAFGTAPDGLLFRGVRGGQLAESTYCRTWRRAREDALSADEGRPRSLAGRTTSATPRCRRDSTRVCPRLSSPSGPGTASRCCCRSTPSASPARRTRATAASLRPSPAHRAELWHAGGTDSRTTPVPTGRSRTHMEHGRECRPSSGQVSGGAPGGVRTHTGTLLRGLPLPVGLRGRSGECRAARPRFVVGGGGGRSQFASAQSFPINSHDAQTVITSSGRAQTAISVRTRRETDRAPGCRPPRRPSPGRPRAWPA